MTLMKASYRACSDCIKINVLFPLDGEVQTLAIGHALATFASCKCTNFY